MVTVAPRVRQTPLSELRVNPANPRRISDERMASLKRSLEADPEMLAARPLIALPDGRVVAGNMRLRAAEELGWKTIPAITVDLDEQRAQLWLLRDNQEYGEWDDGTVAMLLEDLQAAGADLDLTGFADDAVQRLLDSLAPGSEDGGSSSPERGDELREKWGTALGQVWQVGEHRVACADATDSETALDMMGGKAVRLLVTSPPYGDARDYGGNDLRPESLAKFISAWRGCGLICVNLGIVRRGDEVVRYWDAYLDAAQSAGLKLLSWNVWDRGQPWSVAQNTAMFPIEHEWVLVFGSARSSVNKVTKNKTPGMRTGITNRQRDGTLKKIKPKVVHDSRPMGTVFRSPPYLGRDTGHPAMFPVDLPAAYIKATTRRGQVVADPFLGSGTTIVACQETGRVGIGVEIDPGYVAVALERLSALGMSPERVA